MRRAHKLKFILACVLLASSSVALCQSDPNAAVLDKAQRQIVDYLAHLANLHCTESVTQEKFGDNGHVETTAKAQYDYLTMINGTGDEFQLNESRIESSSNHRRGPQASMLVTNGVATALLVFHPYYRDSFTFSVGKEELVDGKIVLPVYFTHISGRRTPIALALRGREFPLELQGTAWLDKGSGEVIKIDANLEHEMLDLGLRSLRLQVNYKPAKLAGTAQDSNLPALAVVDVATTHQHWRNTHKFDSYKSFDTGAEQDPKVTLHAGSQTPEDVDAGAKTTSLPKEKP